MQKNQTYFQNLLITAGTIGLIAMAPEVMAATDDLADVAKGVHGLATGSGMKIGLISASVVCIIAGLVNNAILKPALALGGVAGATPLFMKYIDTKFVILV